jgi:hypothetical protein
MGRLPDPGSRTRVRRIRSAGCRGTALASRRSVRDHLFVHADLVSDEVGRFRELPHLRRDPVPMFAKKLEPYLLVAIARAHEVGVLSERGKRHAGRAEEATEFEPLEMSFGINAPPSNSFHGLSEKPLPFVETECVDAHARARRDLTDAEGFLGREHLGEQ